MQNVTIINNKIIRLYTCKKFPGAAYTTNETTLKCSNIEELKNIQIYDEVEQYNRIINYAKSIDNNKLEGRLNVDYIYMLRWYDETEVHINYDDTEIYTNNEIMHGLPRNQSKCYFLDAKILKLKDVPTIQLNTLVNRFPFLKRYTLDLETEFIFSNRMPKPYLLRDDLAII